MKKIRNFKCGSCQAHYERLEDDEVRVIDCKCGAKATRLLSAPKCFQNTTGKSPSAR